MKRFILFALAILFTFMSATYAKETGSTRVAVDLMAQPFSDAKAAGKLPQNTAVSVLERRGGWLRISTGGKSGWVKLHQVRLGEGASAKKSGEGLAVLKNVGQTGRSGSTGIVATTGIRGLSAEELKAAKPNPQTVDAMEASRANDATARSFAGSAKLKEQTVPFLTKE